MNLEIIKYRRNRSSESIKEAELLLKNKKLHAAVNRIYYAVFYEVVGLLLTRDLSSSKHTGVRSIFNKEFVKTGIVNKEHGEFYNNIFGFRQRGDYEDFVEFDLDKVQSWLKSAKDFIDSTEKIIEGLIGNE